MELNSRRQYELKPPACIVQINGMSEGNNYIAQAALSLYKHYESTPPARAGIMVIQDCQNKIVLKTKLGEVVARLEPKANKEW